MMIICNDKEQSVPENCTGRQLLEELNLTEPAQGLAIRVDGQLRDPNDPIRAGERVEILSFSDEEGKEVFWHTAAHVLAQAVLRLFPDAQPTIGPPIAQGFYYDFANLTLSEEDFKAIEKEVAAILKEGFIPEKETLKDKSAAIARFGTNPFKKELIEELEEGVPITAYKQGEFSDLCRGPHLPSLKKIKAFKLLKTSSAYWRADQSRETLTRVYAIAFPDKRLLKEYLQLIEEAKKRDHRVLGTKLHLFKFFDVAPGMPLILPDGMRVWNALIDYWKEMHTKAHYLEIKTPIMLDKALWEQSGHWENYRENMYTSEVDKGTYAIKPMNCPACMLYFGSTTHSYRDLPLRVGELGNVHRHEMSGSLSGLLRVRSFHQDDAHIFMTPDQIKSEILNVLELADQIYKTFGLSYTLELSTRPESHTIGTDQEWEQATEGLRSALDAWGRDYSINEGDGAFYGPKIDLHVLDALGRSWQCGTIQLDMALPERFNLHYTDSDGQLARPVMIHRALYGSIERFFAILIEHFAGRFPLWLSPRPVKLLPVADRHVAYAKALQKELESQFFCEVDASNTSINKKVREAQLEQVNYMCIVGDREVEGGTVSVRTRENPQSFTLSKKDFLSHLQKEHDERSLIPLPLE